MPSARLKSHASPPTVDRFGRVSLRRRTREGTSNHRQGRRFRAANRITKNRCRPTSGDVGTSLKAGPFLTLVVEVTGEHMVKTVFETIGVRGLSAQPGIALARICATSAATGHNAETQYPALGGQR